MKVFFKTNLFILSYNFHICKLNNLRGNIIFFRVSSLAYPNLRGKKGYVVVVVVFPMFDPNLVQNNFLYQYGGSRSGPQTKFIRANI